MIPLFPISKKLELTDYTLIEKFTKQFQPYNDFEFVSLWTYNAQDKNTISMLHNNFVIRIQDFITGHFFYSFLGTNDILDTTRKLILKSKEEKLESHLRLIPDINISSAPNLSEYFSIKEDPDNFEYILSIDELVSLEGSKYHEKRNLVNRFKRDYPELSVEILDLKNKKIQQKILSLFIFWEDQKRKIKNETLIEFTAIERLFDLIEMVKIIGLGIYMKDKLISFATYHLVENTFAILSFEKCDISYKGIYEYMQHEGANHLKKLGCKYINFEQDLGIPGLRKAKTLWRPIFFLKKYTIEEKT